MQRTIIVLVLAILAVGFAGFIALPWLKQRLFGETKDVKVNILSAFVDNDVGVPGSKDLTVPRIVVEMEVSFPYGAAPESVADLNIRYDDGTPVDVNWGSKEVERRDMEDQSITKFTMREAFFPIDFKQGMLRDKTRELYYIKMPKLPLNPPQH